MIRRSGSKSVWAQQRTRGVVDSGTDGHEYGHIYICVCVGVYVMYVRTTDY